MTESPPAEPASPAPADEAAPADARATILRHRKAAAMLVVATILWGAGFTWAKEAGAGVHRAMGLQDGSVFGPVFVLAWRFLIGGLAAIVAVPATRRGWTWGGARRSLGVGVTLAAG